MRNTFLILTVLALFAFKSNAQSTFTDPRDGNVYNTVTIGTQVWMAENLRYLPSVVGPSTESKTTPYYYVYGYNGTNVTDAKAIAYYTTYGVLYNWPAACSSCPTGWHLPSDTEWTQLTDYLGGASVAGGKLKETGTTHWNSPNTGATNETGFTALPGGYRYFNGDFKLIAYDGSWWSSEEGSTTSAWNRVMVCVGEMVSRDNSDKDGGFSVRCINGYANNVQESNEFKKIQVFPNPATDRITIHITETQNAVIHIYDMVGKCVMTSNLEDGTKDIDVSMLPEGIYVVHVYGNKQTYQIKLIKK